MTVNMNLKNCFACVIDILIYIFGVEVMIIAQLTTIHLFRIFNEFLNFKKLFVNVNILKIHT
jgi:hypothetical protein